MESITPPQQLEPEAPAYQDNIEGKLQYLADLSLYYGAMKKEAQTNFKRQYFQKKLEKNNNKLYKLLVRTPNAFNPLMKYIQESLEPESVEHTIVDAEDTEQVGIEAKVVSEFNLAGVSLVESDEYPIGKTVGESE